MTVVPDVETVELCGALKVDMYRNNSKSCQFAFVAMGTVTLLSEG